MGEQEIIAMIRGIREQIGRVIVGKTDAVDLLLTCLLAGGHALLEDVPGTSKTLLAKALARSLDGTFKRIQFTPDLLPSDVTGISFYNQKQGEFEFRPGPVFAHVLLADEINRATPRTQSSLLECMEERQVTIDGATHRLEQPFLVVATQNPIDQHGTFPLPEAQLDRFLMRFGIGYPSFEEGIGILKRFRAEQSLDAVQPVASAEDVAQAQRKAADVRVSDELLGYIVRIAEASRRHPDVVLGVSPRGSQALLRAAQAYALVQGRTYVIPDDIKRLAAPVLSHRLAVRRDLRPDARRVEEIFAGVLAGVEVPEEPAETR
jgi:MoxR-like ATPase